MLELISHQRRGALIIDVSGECVPPSLNVRATFTNDTSPVAVIKDAPCFLSNGKWKARNGKMSYSAAQWCSALRIIMFHWLSPPWIHQMWLCIFPYRKWHAPKTAATWSSGQTYSLSLARLHFISVCFKRMRVVIFYIFPLVNKPSEKTENLSD